MTGFEKELEFLQNYFPDLLSTIKVSRVKLSAITGMMELYKYKGGHPWEKSRAALDILVKAKKLKESEGVTDEYTEMKDLGWSLAFDIVENSSNAKG